MNMIKNEELYDRKIYYPSNNPKISIIIPVYNGEAFIKETILSIQNQDFKDIEIIIVDDQSTDNSVNLIKELTKTEPRIYLYQNEENKGILNTKIRGISLAKGKYIMLIDDDDKYLQRKAFTTLYTEIEKNNLDILGFKTILSTSFSDMAEYNTSQKFETPIIFQNELKNLINSWEFFGLKEKNNIQKVNHLIKTDLFQKIIKQIDDKYSDFKINYFDDYLLFFLLTRNAKSFKQIDNIFYMKEKIIFTDIPKVNYRKKEKLKNGFNLSCFAYLNIIEILYDKTNNTNEDKKIPFNLFDKLILKNQCKNNMKIREQALKICELFLNNEYISSKDKEKIKIFFKQINYF